MLDYNVIFRCPEVGLEFSLDAPPTKELDRKKSGLGDLTVRAGDRGGGSTLRAKEGSRKKIRGAAATDSPA